MNIVGSNINNTSVNVNCNVYYYDATLGPLKPYIDLPSLSVIAAGGVGTINGVRVESGTGTTNPTGYGGTFNHATNLAITYTNELQMVNGNYVTKAASLTDAYRNYSVYYGNNSVNYSGIANDSTVRFVTFKYTIHRNGAATGTIGVQIDYTGGTAFPISSQLFTNGILFQYKINSYKTNDGIYDGFPNANPTEANRTTVWLNGNAVLPLSGFDTNSWSTPGTGGLNTGGPTNTLTNRYLTIRQDAYNFFDMYIRIGIPMNLACSFRSVSIISYS